MMRTCGHMRLTRCARSMPSIRPARRTSANNTAVSSPCWHSVANAFSALSQGMTRISLSSNNVTAMSRMAASSSTTTATGFALSMGRLPHRFAMNERARKRQRGPARMVPFPARRPRDAADDSPADWPVRPNPGQPESRLPMGRTAFHGAGLATKLGLGLGTPMTVAFDEMNGTDGATRSAYQELAGWLGEVPPDILQQRSREAELLFRRIGITFAVYGEAESTERLIPFDVIPRVLAGSEWATVKRGLEQRVKAINLYIKDIYSKREVLRAGIVPEDLVFQNPVFRPEMNGQRVPHDIYVFIAGIDVVRVDADTFYVLEDNVRTPSAVSYMLENREGMLRLFPELFSRHRVAPAENYPDELLAT